MSSSYEDMMGTEQPVVSNHKATQHYAGDVVSMPMDSSTAFRGAIRDMYNKTHIKMESTLDKTNVVPIKPMPNFYEDSKK